MKRKLFVFMFLVLALGLYTHTVHAYDILELVFGPSPKIGTWGFTTLPGWGIHDITEVGEVLQVNWSVDIIAPGDASLRQLWIQSPEGEANADPPVLLGIFENINGPLPQPFGGTLSEFNGQAITGEWKMWLTDDAGTGNAEVKVVCTFLYADLNQPVELSVFTASVIANDLVELKWVSETESNMLGYHVYRATDNDYNHAEKITHAIIPAHNTSITTQYNYADHDVYMNTTYYYWLESVDLDMTNSLHGPISVIIQDEEDVPGATYVNALYQNYPNPIPFNNPNTTIKYSLRENVNVMSLKVYNVRGQLVRTLIPEGPHAKGEYQAIWDGRNEIGQTVTSGIYFYRMTTPTFDRIEKMIMVK